MKRIGVVLALALLLAMLAGCGKSGAPAAATPAAQEPASGGQTNEASPTEPADMATAVPAVEATGGTGSDGTALALADEETSLQKLNSYRSTWSFEWSGKKDGKDQVIKWLSEQAYTSEPKATYTKFETSDSLEPGQSGSMEFYQIGDKSYMVSVQDGKPQCTAFTSTDNTPSGSFLDRSAFGSISSGDLVGAETLNGVKTKHYKYDEKATGVKMFSKLTGDVWVAEDGDYVVKDVANWEGALFGMLGGGSTTDVGKGTWTREVTDINQKFEITPPAGCENAAETLPMMTDASDQTSFGAMTTYKSASKLADVAQFYKDAMAKAGWTAESDAMATDQFATLSFTKDGKKANVVLTVEDGKTSVMITVE
jgi:predicted small lipoprotein YifL